MPGIHCVNMPASSPFSAMPRVKPLSSTPMMPCAMGVSTPPGWTLFTRMP